MAEVADGIHRVVELRATEILSGFRNGGNEMRVLCAREGDHGESMRKRREVLLELVGRAASRNEQDLIEIEAAVGGTGDGHMTVVDRVE